MVFPSLLNSKTASPLAEVFTAGMVPSVTLTCSPCIMFAHAAPEATSATRAKTPNTVTPYFRITRFLLVDLGSVPHLIIRLGLRRTGFPGGGYSGALRH